MSTQRFLSNLQLAVVVLLGDYIKSAISLAKHGVTSCIVTLFLLSSLCAGINTETMLKQSGIDNGLCVVLGYGDGPAVELVAECANSGKFLIHVIVFDEKELEHAKIAILTKGVEGSVSVEELKISPLPYRDNLVDLLVIPDLKKAKVAGFRTAEALRVLTPNGKLLINDGDKWEVTTKPLPNEMDVWAQDNHDPGGSRLSTDTAVRFPLGYRWHAGLPMNIRNMKIPSYTAASTRAIAINEGRCFTISTSVLENLGSMYTAGHGINHYLTARNAFNGLFLWRHNLGATSYGGLFYPNRAPLAAVDNRVYAASNKGQILVFEAGTGRIINRLDTEYATGRLLVDDGIVVTANWDSQSVGGINHGMRRWGEDRIRTGTVEAFDAATGKKLWTLNKFASSIRSSEGILFMLHRDGPYERNPDIPTPPTNHPTQTILALDLKTGRELWTVDGKTLGKAYYLHIDSAGLGTVAINHDCDRRTSILSAKDGKLLLTSDQRGYAGYANGTIQVASWNYDPKTGAKLERSFQKIPQTVCSPTFYVNGIKIDRKGAYDVASRKRYIGVRGGCFFAGLPAYGSFYAPQNWCRCAPGQIPGFICFGRIDKEPTPEEMEKPAELKKGRELDNHKHGDRSVRADDWPMDRCGPERNNSTSAEAPTNLSLLWKSSASSPIPDTLVTKNWKEYLNSLLTAPVVAEGIVVTADPGRNKVIALNQRSGSILWTFSTGGRVDSAPTIYKGLCLFGAHDGYLYAVSVKKGQLVWKRRIAPREERMVSYGKVESPWPVIGTVLVDKGIGYTSAGRTQASDGGIVIRAFRPLTGEIIWSTAINSENSPLRRNDMLLCVGDAIQMMRVRMDPKTGKFKKNPTQNYLDYLEKIKSRNRLIARKGKKPEEIPVPIKPQTEIAPSAGHGGFISWNWTRLGRRKSISLNYGDFTGDIISWDSRFVCTGAGNRKGRSVITLFTLGKVKPFSASGRGAEPYFRKPDPESLKWQSSLPAENQATSLIICSNAIVVGGGVYTDGKAARGFIKVLNLSNGKTLSEAEFDAPLTYNGLAVTVKTIYATFNDGLVVCLGDKKP